MHERGKNAETSKRCIRTVAKVQKAIAGASLKDIKKKKSQISELGQQAKEGAAMGARATQMQNATYSACQASDLAHCFAHAGV